MNSKESQPSSVDFIEVIDEMDNLENIEIHFPEYESLTDRLKTFDEKFPVPNLAQSLAEAGFFFIGIKDWVVCYHCALGLKNCIESEPPFAMHAIFFPFCPLVLEHAFSEKVEEYDDTKTETKIITEEDVNERIKSGGQNDEICQRFLSSYETEKNVEDEVEDKLVAYFAKKYPSV